VLKEKFFVPPSGLKPHAAAMVSSKVDFSEPFSPIMNVTARRMKPQNVQLLDGIQIKGCSLNERFSFTSMRYCSDIIVGIAFSKLKNTMIANLT
jgi:hypothetical protein